MTTGNANSIGQTGATLSASFEGISGGTIFEAGFEYGTSQNNLNQTVWYNDGLSGSAGSFSAAVGSLDAGTTYWYRAWMQVGAEVFYGAVRSFTTQSASSGTGTIAGWLELPAVTGDEDYLGTFRAGGARNYTYAYDYGTFTMPWAAYPLYAAAMAGSGTSTWHKNPDIAERYQINIWSGSYGVNNSGPYYPSTPYSRGHQVPNADRNGIDAMQAQVYYATNSTPQIQDGFNGSVWSSLENAIRGAVPSSDTLYVVTGATFRKVGGSESITYIKPQNDTKQCPVPNYYWKVVLKVKRSGGTVTSARAVGFWLEHRQYAKGTDFKTFAVSVDAIEQYTGLDFFVNLPGDNTSGIEATAESNNSWDTFYSFK